MFCFLTIRLRKLHPMIQLSQKVFTDCTSGRFLYFSLIDSSAWALALDNTVPFFSATLKINMHTTDLNYKMVMKVTWTRYKSYVKNPDRKRQNTEEALQSNFIIQKSE